MGRNSYVLVTPVRNEEATIGITIESVLRQIIPPLEWVIVSDQSTDQTDEIVRRHSTRHPFIRLLRLERGAARSFSSVVFATEAGVRAVQARGHDYLGLLDGDIRLPENYYQEMIDRFERDPLLGLAGGLVTDVYEGRRYPAAQIGLDDVAGAVQFFRRGCFEAMGRLIALPEGGWDVITCLQVRQQGFKTKTFADISVDHLKPRNMAEGNVLKRTWALGVRDYALGYHPLFAILKCCFRCKEHPIIAGGMMRLTGFLWCYLRQRKRLLPKHITRALREQQMRRMLPFRKPAEHVA